MAGCEGAGVLVCGGVLGGVVGCGGGGVVVDRVLAVWVAHGSSLWVWFGKLIDEFRFGW